MKAPRYMKEYAEHIKSECEDYDKRFPENEDWKKTIKKRTISSNCMRRNLS